jgi:hypothetical protein
VEDKPVLGKLLLIGPVLLVAVSMPAGADKGPATKDDLYPVYEHGEGRWLAFDAPLRVRQDLKTPGLREYKLTLTVSILVREGKQAEVRFTFAEEGTFMDALRPELPSSTHVDLVIGEQSSVALPLTASGFTDFGGERQVATHFATVPLHTFKKMVTAKSLGGRLYWRSTDGEVVGQNELRFFTLDEKALRTLAALDAKAR